MLRQAKSGRLTGLIYLARLGKEDHGIHVVGHYQNHPKDCLDAVEAAAPMLRKFLKDFHP
jgi:hypothetical protein